MYSESRAESESDCLCLLFKVSSMIPFDIFSLRHWHMYWTSMPKWLHSIFFMAKVCNPSFHAVTVVNEPSNNFSSWCVHKLEMWLNPLYHMFLRAWVILFLKFSFLTLWNSLAASQGHWHDESSESTQACESLSKISLFLRAWILKGQDSIGCAGSECRIKPYDQQKAGYTATDTLAFFVCTDMCVVRTFSHIMDDPSNQNPTNKTQTQTQLSILIAMHFLFTAPFQPAVQSMRALFFI